MAQRAGTSHTCRTWIAGAVLLSTLAGCGGSDGPTDPPDPPGPASVTVRALVDTVGVVGSTLQLAAEAFTATGSTVAATFTWTSSNQGVATVNGSGLVTFNAAGSVTITATTGTVSGTIAMRAIVADLSGLQLALTDPYVTALVSALSPAPRATVTNAMAACQTARAAGAMTGVRNCLTTLMGATGPEGAILATLALFWRHAQRLLGFTT